MSTDTPALPDAFYTLSLSPPQQAVLAALTPFRFRAVSPPSSAPFLEPYLPLAAPPAVPFPLILTPPRPTDIPHYLSTLNHPAVCFNLVGPPYPYLPEHAIGRGELKGGETTRYFALLGEKAAAALEQHGGDVDAATAALVGKGKELPRDWLPQGEGVPFTTIRRADTDEFVGDMSTFRWNFEDLTDAEEKERLAKENAERETGDPELQWSFGFYLSPAYHGQRLMSPLLSGLLDTYVRPFHRAQTICGAAFASNAGSLRTQEKNGLVRFGSWTRQISEARGGGTAEVVTLRWRKADAEEAKPTA